MAHVAHPGFSPPDDRNATIWRYMDLTKFLSLIDKSSLYFIRNDRLLSLDPYEGSYTHLNSLIGSKEFPLLESVEPQILEYIENKKKQMIQEENKTKEEAEEWGIKQLIKDKEKISQIAYAHHEIPRLTRKYRENIYVNSWHLQEYESAAMWNLYARHSDGIAIESSYSRFISSFENYDEFSVYIGTVKYIDYRSSVIPVDNLYSPFMHKRKSFEHEKELRALINTPLPTYPEGNRYQEIYGLHVKVNLDTLINRIFVAPTAEHWIKELLRSILDRYNIEKEIIQSDLFTSAPQFN